MVDFIGQNLIFLIIFFTGTTTSGSTIKKKGHPNLPKLPADANDLPAESRWPHWVTARDGH